MRGEDLNLRIARIVSRGKAHLFSRVLVYKIHSISKGETPKSSP